jgi:hypothetical protein
MHHKQSPLTSGRVVLWRTIPFLFISPILTTFLNHHDLLIYLPVLYTFLLLLLFQYRALCHEWATWPSKIPTIKEEDIVTWYIERMSNDSSEEKLVATSEAVVKSAQRAFREEVANVEREALNSNRKAKPDNLVAEVAQGLPFAIWLLEKDNLSKPISETSEPFTKSWLVRLDQALQTQQGLVQGLKEHSIFMLFRHGKYDVSMLSRSINKSVWVR